MPAFKNKEEYQKWKIEKETRISENLKNQKDEEERIQKKEKKLKKIIACGYVQNVFLQMTLLN